MKTMLILVCLLFVCAVMVLGQEKPAGNAEQVIERKYDRFKDETTVRLKPQIIRQITKPKEELSLSLEAIYKGERSSRPKEVALIFDSISERNVFFRKADVFFIVDGKRVNAGTAYEVDGIPGPNLVKSTLKLSMPFESFLLVSNGKVIEMRLENEVAERKVEIQFTEKVLAGIREFGNSFTRESKSG